MTSPSTRTTRTDDVRDRLLDAAEEQLNAARDHDISTRAVCEAVGVGQPVLYRQFGDKAGLLEALVDRGFDRYITRKVSLESTPDPVVDLVNGWNDHMAFAHANPALYRLMFSPVLNQVPAAAGRIFDLLKAQLDRCAAAGLGRLPSASAAQMILSANVGVALNQLSQPERYADPDLSGNVRDAVFAACVDTSGVTSPGSTQSMLGTSALQVKALLSDGGSPLEDEETALLIKWLGRL